MSSKSAPEPRRPWSLAARLTAAVAGSAFALVAAVTAFLYWALCDSLDRQDDGLLADKVRVIEAVLGAAPAALRQEVGESAQAPQHSPLYVRLLQEGVAADETPGMAALLPASAFPAPGDRGADVGGPAGGRFRVVATAGPRPGLVIQVGLDRTRQAGVLADYRGYAWAALSAAGLACGGAGYWTARHGLRPLRAIAATAARVRPGRLGERIGPDGLPAELLELAGAFNAMLARLEWAFERLGRFSADIAHELRTPVNNLRGGIEVALGRDRGPAEYREVLASGLEECDRLGRTIDSLLFLARAEDPRARADLVPLGLRAELLRVAEFYAAAAEESGVLLGVSADDGLTLAADRALFQRAVCNLIANALAHTPPGGAVTLSGRAEAGAVVVEVADTGPGIPAEHLPHVFDRFYRADPSRRSAGGHLGLGLAIVKGIMELHGGAVTAAAGTGRGASVTMRFPAG